MKWNKYLAYCLSASLAFSAMTPMNIMAEEVILGEEEIVENAEQESQTGDVKEDGAEEGDMEESFPENQLTNVQNVTDSLPSEGEIVIEDITVEDDLSDVPVAEYTAEELYGTALMAEDGSTATAASVDWTALTEGSTVSYKYDAESKTLEFKSSKTEGEALPDGTMKTVNAALETILKEAETVVIGVNITAVGSHNFDNISGECANLKTVQLSDSVKTLGDYAFDQGTLQNINLTKVQKFGAYCFRQSGLKNVTLEASNIELGECVFLGCGSLETFRSKNAIETISKSTFKNCKKLAVFDVPSVTTIGDSAFYQCWELLEIKASGITSIDKKGFYSCKKLAAINLTDVNVTFAKNAFGGCNNLTTVCYNGTSEQWSAKSNQPTTASVHYNQGDQPELKAATCTETGIGEMTCAVCGKDYHGTIAALGHQCDKLETTNKPATCEEAGSGVYSCSREGCTATQTKSIAALGHEYGEYKATTPATCTEWGVETRTCIHEGCTKSEEKDIEPLGHEYGAYKEVKAASCEEKGKEVRTCIHEGCTKSEEREIASLGHDYQKKVTTAATCAKDGVQSTICSRCQKAEKTESIKATGEHQWSEWKTVSKATVFAAEHHERSCAGCGAKESKTVGSVLAGKASLNAVSVTLKVKQSTSKLAVTGMANGDSVKSWKSSNTKVLKVEGKADGTCKLTAKKKGTAKVEIVLASGLKKTITVKVQSDTVKTTAIKGLDKKVTLTKGSKKTLNPVITPITSQQKVTYSASNKKIVSVDKNGVLTAKKAGTAKITVKSGSKKFVVTVTVPKTKTTKINVASEASVKKGKTLKLKVTLNPTNSDEKITYTSSNKKIATVDKNGKIKGIKKGSVKITVKSGTQKETVKVTVK